MLEFKGICTVDEVACAIVGYDSGESNFRMTLALGNGLDAVMKGGSEYKGDMYIDLETGWVRKVTLDEFVVTEAEATNAPSKVYGYTVRHLLLRLVDQLYYASSPITLLASSEKNGKNRK